MPLRDCSHETYQLGVSLLVIDHIGSGGNAAVVLGVDDREPSRKLALKLLDPRSVNADDMERDFRKFNHPNLLRIDSLLNLADLGLVQIPDWYSTILNCEPEAEDFPSHTVTNCTSKLDSWRQKRNDKTLAEFGVDEFFILVMEYCPMSLSDHILEHSRSMKEVHRIMTEVCAGLTEIHNEGLIHTDLSIENILMTKEGLVKIIDFGLSEHWEEGIRKVIRNPSSTAPELFSGEGDPRSDIYSLGLLAFELATGKNLLSYDIFDENEDVSELNVQKSFVLVCKQAAQYFPDDRFSTADDFLKALNKSVTSFPEASGDLLSS